MDNMPYEVATALLLSGQKMTSQFKKNCQRARERVAAPISRSTQLPISAPRTGAQRLQVRLRKATAKQLHTWAKRTLARGNRYQDLLAKTEAKYSPSDADDDAATLRIIELLKTQISAHDRLCEAITAELTNRATRGTGYRKPIKWTGRLILS